MKRSFLLLLLLISSVAAFPDSHSDDTLDGFSPAASSVQRAYEQLFRENLSAENIQNHLKWLTSHPHRAGTEGARKTADYIQQRLQEYGFDTEIVRYDAYLPAPVSVSLELEAPTHERLAVTEEQVEGDPFTEHVNEHPGWNGYSPSGKATGDVIYAHFGSTRDFETLKLMDIDVRGKIVLIRNFGTGEGRKVRNAEDAGAVGVVLYTDPQEDGFPYGDVYPKGNWRPPGSIMRRSIIFLPYEGDPLSPGYASVPGVKRLKPEEVSLPRIPVLPVSYGTAKQILSLLEGSVAPYQWQGALGLTYRTGPGPAKLSIRTEMDNRDRPMWNVIAKLKGEKYPDQWIIAGNHHDAWIFGAGDPSSGTASLLETARSIGLLAKQGHHPDRTLILAFWDAEEMLLGGSTEWVEDHGSELLEKAVACINMDSAVFNTQRPLSVAAHPLLHSIFRNVSRDVTDPRTGRSTYEVWLDMQNRYRTTPSVDGWGEFFDPDQELKEPAIFSIPYDDAAPFYNYLALPSSDMYYGADYGMYHSIYENFHWMKTVVDPEFQYHVVMSQMQGIVTLRLANAEILPFDFTSEVRYWKQAYEDLDRVARARNQEVPNLQRSLDLLREWESEASGLKDDIAKTLSDPVRFQTMRKYLPDMNSLIYHAPRNFYRERGRPGAETERNLLAGSSYEFSGVSGSTLPGVRFNLDQGNLEEAEKESILYNRALEFRVTTMKAIREKLRTP